MAESIGEHDDSSHGSETRRGASRLNFRAHARTAMPHPLEEKHTFTSPRMIGEGKVFEQAMQIPEK